MLFAGFGAFLEKVFITSKERARLSEYLENGVLDLPANIRFCRFLERAHSIIFEKYFSAKLLSLRFFFSAAIISITSFTLVFAAQNYFFPEQFLGLHLDYVQILLIFAFILFNVTFDYITIIQTKIFIEASLSAQSIFRSIVFIGADLIVTMNTFVLSYAVFILLIVQIFISQPKPATLTFSDASSILDIAEADVTQLKEKYFDAIFLSKIKYWGSIRSTLTAENIQSDNKEVVLYYYSTFRPDASVVQAQTLVTLTELNISNLVINETNPEENKNHQNSTENLISIPEYNQKKKDEPRLAVSFDVDGSIIRNGSLTGAYTGAFNLTDALEDSFPASILGSAEMPQLSTLVENSVVYPHPNAPVVICYEKNTPIFRIQVYPENVMALNHCENFLLIELFWSNNYDKNLILNGRDTNYRVPFNTLFITSILPTAFFYFAIVLLAIATLLFTKVIKSTNKCKRFFLRAPLAISGFMLGVVLQVFRLI